MAMVNVTNQSGVALGVMDENDTIIIQVPNGRNRDEDVHIMAKDIVKFGGTAQPVQATPPPKTEKKTPRSDAKDVNA